MKIGSIVIRCYEFDKMLAFWQEALHTCLRLPFRYRSIEAPTRLGVSPAAIWRETLAK
jgi:hypothetical protein